MADALEPEWQEYRRACDQVDLLRYHPAFDSGGDLDERLYAAETLADFIDAALQASDDLIAAARCDKDIDSEWLDSLRESHTELVDYADRTRILVDETEQRLRPAE